MKTIALAVVVTVVAIQGFTPRARAELTRVEITSRTDVLGGKPFGPAGAYQKITGKAHFSVDPTNPRNRAIVDIDKTRRDSAGRVTFSADIQALVPADAARGNGVALVDVLNRGRKNALRDFNRSVQVPDPTSEADFGDGFLLRKGFTVVWVGWQYDIPHQGGLMGLDAPLVIEDGKPVTGRISTIFVPNTKGPIHPLNDMSRYADTTRYPPVDPASPANTLTVRDGFLAPARAVPRERWQLGRLMDGKVVPDITALHLEGGFEPGHVYELSYEASGAVVAGLGMAALRDVASAVKRQQAGPIVARQTIAFGPSQDGRLLRQFVYEGFNADEQGRRAFDGIIANIAGSARGGDYNARFARPNGLGFFNASLFPYLDRPQRDPVTGNTDGLQKRLEPGQRPRIFYTNSSGEYWGGGRAAALTHTTLDGRRDADVPANVRIYLFSGTQHVPGGYLPSQGEGQQKPNPNEYAWSLRALLVAMERWVRDGVEPPRSAHPRLSDGTLVSHDRIAFPAIPGMTSPKAIPAGYRADLPGVPSAHPLPLLVPQVDADGNERSGIRLPNVAVPLATYTGWNFRSPSIGQPGELLPLTGTYVPFAVTRQQRDETRDPRLSVEERYAGREQYKALVAAAAQKLVEQRYLMADDKTAVIDSTLERWDGLVKGTPLAGK